MNLLDRVIEHEGFEEKPYQCSENVWTFGHGLTFITEDESRDIVRQRLINIRERLLETNPWLYGAVLEVMTEMVFQLGWKGCHNFKKMWNALASSNYSRAADEMLDSKWAKQTPARAEELAGIIRGCR